jgi:hypothetical protein
MNDCVYMLTPHVNTTETFKLDMFTFPYRSHMHMLKSYCTVVAS